MAEIVNKDNFQDKVLDAKTPVLVDFFATWCGPCRAMSPIVDELAAEAGDRFAVYKLDIDESRELARQYRVMSVPTFIVFNDGIETERQVGGMDKASLLELMGF